MGTLQILYESIKQEVQLLLKSYEHKTVETDEEIDPSRLYEANKSLNDKLSYLKLKLELELDDNEANLKRYGFHKIVKFINPNTPASFYHIQIEKKWKQVNDPQKVLLRLDEELSVWSNTYRLHSYKELEALEEADEAFIKEQKALIDNKIKEAAKECKRIKDNFEHFADVRICSKHRAHNYGTIHYTVGQKKYKKHLSSKLPNVIYFKKPDFRSNNKLDEFLDEAKNIFGDVWYIE